MYTELDLNDSPVVSASINFIDITDDDEVVAVGFSLYCSMMSICRLGIVSN
ncbi:hypothetical protein ACJIZ3_021497 [Penstemon smallii]|uniref:Uncharacterized protein n=1 Tax=Penstemon smallii TaxID=265156 RepID=A0ABD3SMB7_9LAMI